MGKSNVWGVRVYMYRQSGGCFGFRHKWEGYLNGVIGKSVIIQVQVT
jgi:hypothetical protein